MTGAEGMVRALIDQGVKTVYALPGAQIDHFFCGLYDTAPALRLITSRHEQGAAYMALGHARSTGTPAVYAVVPGPGWLNTGAALATAYGCYAPVLSIAGQIPSTSIGKGYGELHEIPDQLAMARGLTKWAKRIARAEDAALDVVEAFRQLRSGVPRPVHLEMALDIMGTRAVITPPGPVALASTAIADGNAIDRAASFLAAADHPAIFVGAGAQGASAEISQLAERLHAPVVSLRSGRGVVSDRSDLAQPWVNGHRFWGAADVALAIGTRLDFQRRHWGEDPQLKIIRLDIDPEQMTRISTPEVALVGDAAATVKALLVALGSKVTAKNRDLDLAQIKAGAFAAMRRGMAPQMAYLDAIRAALPEDGFFVDELTQIGYASWSYFPTYRPRTYVSSGYQGTLGYGFPTSLGVKAANPGRCVVSVTGDGGFLFGLPELASAVQHGLAVVVVVFRDDKFGNVQRIQKERYGGKVLGTDLHNPDFVALARSFGADAERCGDPDALRRALERGFGSGRPTVIEVPVGDFPSPWPFIVLPRNRSAQR